MNYFPSSGLARTTTVISTPGNIIITCLHQNTFYPADSYVWGLKSTERATDSVSSVLWFVMRG